MNFKHVVKIKESRWLTADKIKTVAHKVVWPPTIPRSALVTGEPELKGMKCCLGFALQQIGKVKVRSMLNVTMPSGVKLTLRQRKLLTEAGLLFDDHYSSEIAARLAVVNDDPDLSDAERKIKLNEIAAEIGLRFEFVP